MTQMPIDMETVDITLKPCPFCGGKASYVEHIFNTLLITYGVKCDSCEVQTYQFCNSKAAANGAWNRRYDNEDAQS